jgi:putative membrane protein
MIEILIRWILFSIGLLFISWAIPGIIISNFLTALWASIVIGLINIFIKPILIILTFPINLLTLGLFTFVINALLFWLSSKIVPGFFISGFWAAFWGSVLFSIITIIINSIE